LFYFRDEQKALEFKQLRDTSTNIAQKATDLVLGSIPLTTFREPRSAPVFPVAVDHHTRDHCLQLTVGFGDSSRDFIVSCASDVDAANWIEAFQSVHDFERKSRIEQFTKLCDICKHPFFGGYVHCTEVRNAHVWA